MAKHSPIYLEQRKERRGQRSGTCSHQAGFGKGCRWAVLVGNHDGIRYYRSELLLQSNKSSAGNGSGKRERERGGGRMGGGERMAGGWVFTTSKRKLCRIECPQGRRKAEGREEKAGQRRKMSQPEISVVETEGRRREQKKGKDGLGCLRMVRRVSE